MFLNIEQVFPFEFCEISTKNTLFAEHFWTAASTLPHTVRGSRPKVYYKNVFRKSSQNSQENTSHGFLLLLRCRLMPFDASEFFQNSFFIELVTATAKYNVAQFSSTF